MNVPLLNILLTSAFRSGELSYAFDFDSPPFTPAVAAVPDSNIDAVVSGDGDFTSSALLKLITRIIASSSLSLTLPSEGTMSAVDN